MMNGTLFRKEVKSNSFLLIIFICILAMYSCMIVYMFDPKLGDSLKNMADSMPEIFAAFGMADVGQTLLEFITGYLYGILFTAFPSVFFITLANKLVAKYVDNGSMVYILSGRDSRKTIIRTQAMVMVFEMTMLIIVSAAIIIVCAQVLFPGELDLAGFARATAGLFGLWIFVGGLCFMCSCVFNESKMAVGISSGVVIYSILVQMISQVGDKLEVVRYATPFTLFSVDELVKNSRKGWIMCGVLYALGIIMFIIGKQTFKRKNLPI